MDFGFSNLKLWVAQGFGVGRIPFGPGTFGSIVGLGWVALLLGSGKLWIYIVGTIAGIALSVWLCGEGEKILKQKDPGSIVLDEIAAIPVCFAMWVWIHWRSTGSIPSGEKFLSNWPILLIGFAAFRFFDIVKPWPVKQSQSLAGGWGVTVDDVLAGVYTALVLALCLTLGLK